MMQRPGPAEIDTIVRRLRAAGCVYAEDEADLLVDNASNLTQLERHVARRVEGEPLEYIVGWAEFCGLRIAVTPGVFVPRLRTTAVVREALRVAPPAPVVLDICCGAGGIGAAILSERPDATVHAADIDRAAGECARRTLAAVWRTRVVSASATPRAEAASDAVTDFTGGGTLGAASNAAPTGDAHQPHADTHQPTVYVGDLYDPLPRSLRGRVDVIVANAPYVPSDDIRLMPPEAREHEAPAALDGGVDGLKLQRRVARGARKWLVPGGHLLIETSRGQASATAALLEQAGFSASIVRHDDVEGTVAIGRAPLSTADAFSLRSDGDR